MTNKSENNQIEAKEKCALIVRVKVIKNDFHVTFSYSQTNCVSHSCIRKGGQNKSNDGKRVELKSKYTNNEY